MKILVAICMCMATRGFAQQRDSVDFGLGARLNRMDAFLEADANLAIHRWNYTAALGFGIGRTIFQRRLYPEMRMGVVYQLVHKKAFSMGPVLSIAASALRVNRNSSRINWWQEYTLGYALTAGKRLKFTQRAEIGPMAETYHSAFENRLRTGWTWTYSLQIGLRYAW
jgi:hypothetical protein